MSAENGRIAVGSMADITAAGRATVKAGDGREIVVFVEDGELYAYENTCPHLGGPACDGQLMPRVEAVVDEDGSVIRHRFDHTDKRIVCPWHGYEFHLKTGVCAADKRFRLRSMDVVQDGDMIYAVVS